MGNEISRKYIDDVLKDYGDKFSDEEKQTLEGALGKRDHDLSDVERSVVKKINSLYIFDIKSIGNDIIAIIDNKNNPKMNSSLMTNV